MSKIKEFLFPNLEEVDPSLKEIFARQAGTSLFLIFALLFAISIFIFGISLVSNIKILVLSRSLIALVVGMLIILALHKILRGEHRDMVLLIVAVVFIATWGVAKDIANFNVLFNSYGIVYIVVLFIGMIQMPFKPRASLFLGLYCAALYAILWFALVRPVFGPDWIARAFGEEISEFVKIWIQSMPADSTSPFRHFKFYSTWYVLQYPILGLIAFVFRAANLHSHLKTFLADKTLATKEAELNATKALLLKPESQNLEFKSSLRWDYHTQQPNKKLEEVVVKTIAGFMNAEGGILFIGVDDDGKPLGLENDYTSLHKKDADGLQLQLYRLITDYLGVEFSKNITISFPNIQNVEVCSITVIPNDTPVFVKKLDGAFYVRTGNQTQHLNAQETMEYIAKHFE
ncbi:putative DNA binding domain-containing protein [bacterium]|nr:putative DNA binding domain-containing protein [bacterium]